MIIINMRDTMLDETNQNIADLQQYESPEQTEVAPNKVVRQPMLTANLKESN